MPNGPDARAKKGSGSIAAEPGKRAHGGTPPEAARAATSPSTRSMPPMIAPDNGLPRMIAVSSIAMTLAVIIGPAASGFLYSSGAWVAYAVSLGAQLLGLGGILLVQFRRQSARSTDRPTMHHALEGLRFIRHTPL